MFIHFHFTVPRLFFSEIYVVICGEPLTIFDIAFYTRYSIVYRITEHVVFRLITSFCIAKNGTVQILLKIIINFQICCETNIHTLNLVGISFN